MAYVSQEKKKELAPAIKAVLKKYGMKGTIGVHHHMSLVVNIKSGVLDLLGAAQKHVDLVNERKGMKYGGDIGDYLQVNEHYAAEWAREVGEEKIANFYDELVAAMKGVGWYNNSDPMTDYFDIAHYIDINVGKWNKGYELAA
jgi:hypothetical protein